MDRGFEVRPTVPLDALQSSRGAVVLWQTPPHEAPRVLGRFAAVRLAAHWWEAATGTPFDPVWHKPPHPLERVAERVKPRVWCGGLSPTRFVAWTGSGDAVEIWRGAGRALWETPQALETALWREGLPWSWWTPAGVRPDSPHRADDARPAIPDPVWYLGQGPRGGFVLWQWVHDAQSAYRLRWIEAAADPHHAPYEWPKLDQAVSWVRQHDPGRPVAGYAPTAVRAALVAQIGALAPKTTLTFT